VEARLGDSTQPEPAGDSNGRPGIRELGSILKETGLEWLDDGIPARGAALSYYVLLSLGPLLVLVIGALEFFLTTAEARGRVVEAVGHGIGPRAAEVAATVLQRVDVPDLLAPQSLLTLALLLFGATAAFANVRGALNKIWGVEEEGRSKREMAMDLLRARARGFVMIVLTGLVLVVSFLVTSLGSLLQSYLQQWVDPTSPLVRGLDAGVSLLLTGLLFGAIYRTLPSTRIRWGTVWVGAFATALIFVIGKSIVAWLIASASWTSYYGPGASVVAFLAWIYFSSQLFFLGAEFTEVWSRRRGGVLGQSS
jgi:membrane protein